MTHCKNYIILETKVSERKPITMDEQNKDNEASQLKRMYVRSDARFVKRLNVAVAMRGGDQSDFLREAIELYICGIFAADGGNLGIHMDSEN